MGRYGDVSEFFRLQIKTKANIIKTIQSKITVAEDVSNKKNKVEMGEHLDLLMLMSQK